jgi:hypothetical protein
MKALDIIKNELKSNIEAIQQSTAAAQQNTNIGEETRAAAKEATEAGKADLEITREIKTKGLQKCYRESDCRAGMTFTLKLMRAKPFACE